MADAALVPQPVLDQLHQPFVVHRIIEAPNVGSEYPGAVAFLHAYRDGIQRMVRAASRTGTVREAEPRWLVHGVEHLDRRPLNDLVFQRRLAAGPLAPISLGAVDRLDRGRLVRSPLEPGDVPAVAFRVCGARRHPGMARFRGSIPCLHVPLATLHGLRYRSLCMTRGQGGWLDLPCQRLALLHIVPVYLGTPQRQA
jgi:hypothetical protein